MSKLKALLNGIIFDHFRYRVPAVLLFFLALNAAAAYYSVMAGLSGVAKLLIVFLAGLVCLYAWNNRRLLSHLQKHYDEEVTQNLHKTRFIRNAYHEVRNQLWGIFSITRVLATAKEQDTLREIPDLDDIIQTLRNGCCNLETILTNILDYSQYDAGISPKPLYEPVNAKHLLENLVESVRFTAAERNVLVRMYYPSHVPEYLVIDAGKLIQIVTNLTNNAIKFTRQYSCVEIRVDAQHDQWRVTVKDEGQGVAKEKMKVLFDPFVVDRGYGNSKGVGLGLHISHLLTQALGGTIDVRTIPGQGSEFSVCLPILEEAPRPVYQHKTKKPRRKTRRRGPISFFAVEGGFEPPRGGWR